MDKRIITLTTDFGTRDGYVGVMKGVIAGISPDAAVIDISHEIAPQDISEASTVLRDSYRYFPKGTIHLVIVDPGVGGNRRPIIVEVGDYTFIGPDNGVFTPIYDAGDEFTVYEISNRDIFLPDISRTFHGRDIFAPAAAAISRGIPVPVLGHEINDYVRMKGSRPVTAGDTMQGEVVHVDNFGNLITNIGSRDLYDFIGDQGFEIDIRGKRLNDIKGTYSEVKSGETAALIGSSNRLEIAVNQGDASHLLHAEKGSPVEIRRGKGRVVPYKLSLFLFIATIISTIMAGAMQQGVNPILEPHLIYVGFPFSFTLILILLVHEMGHYIAARRHGVHATLPYFIPAPPYIPIPVPPYIVQSIFGTFGAVISMKELPRNRTALMDIGAAGPLAGFVVALLAYIIGLYLPSGSSELTMSAVGESMLSKFLIWLIKGDVPDYALFPIHPIGFAGWLGLLVTVLNLLPIGQLDGGHITYALFGDRHRYIAGFTIFILVFMGIFFWFGWLFWAALTLLIGIRHPRPVDPYTPLDGNRRLIGIAALIIFIIAFIPKPF